MTRKLLNAQALNISCLVLLMTFLQCQKDDIKIKRASLRLKQSLDSARQAEAKHFSDKSENSPSKNSLKNARTNGTFPYKFYTLYRGENSQSIFKSFSYDGLNWYGNAVLGNGALTPISPTVTFFKDKLITVYKGSSTNDIWFSYSYDGNTWYGNRKLGNSAATKNKICACEWKNRLYIFYTGQQAASIGSNSHYIYYSYTDDGINWFGDIKINGSIFDGPSCVVLGDKILVGGQDSKENFDNSYFFTSSDGWNFTATSATFTSKASSTLAVYRNQLYFATTSSLNGELYIQRSTDGGKTWYDVGTGNSFGLSDIRSSPYLTVINNLLYIFYRGKSSNGIFYHTFDGENWSREYSIPNAKTSASPTAISTVSTDQPYAQQNRALNALASATSTYPNYSVNNIKDGDRLTKVGPAYSWTNLDRLPQSVTLDFKTAIPFSTVDLFSSTGYVLQSYTLQYSNDGINWTAITTVYGNTEVHRRHTFPTTTARFLRVTCHLGPSNQTFYGRINEIEVY